MKNYRRFGLELLEAFEQTARTRPILDRPADQNGVKVLYREVFECNFGSAGLGNGEPLGGNDVTEPVGDPKNPRGQNGGPPCCSSIGGGKERMSGNVCLVLEQQRAYSWAPLGAYHI